MTYDDIKTPGRAAGGHARADALSEDERREIARRGAAARWEEVPEAVAGAPDHPLVVGDVSIECYVLEDGTRVITQGSFLRALGRSRTVRRVDPADGLPPIIQGQSLKPFLSEGLLERAGAIPFRAQGRKALGYHAELLPDVCDAFLAARAAGALPANQMHIADQAEMLVRGLARVGIIALVDEATGYQDIRARDALAKILEEFIAREIQPYLVTFPPEFYKQMFRLRGVAYSSDAGAKRPQYFGRLTNDIIYSRLAPGVLEELKRVQERTAAGYPRHKLFQKLTANHGYLKLREHLGSVIAIMTFSQTWEEFKARLDILHPPYDGQERLELDFADPGGAFRDPR